MRRAVSEAIALFGAINVALMARLTWLAVRDWWARNRRSQLGWAGIAFAWTLGSVIVVIRWLDEPLRVRPDWINASVIALLALSALSAADAMNASINNRREEDGPHES